MGASIDEFLDCKGVACPVPIVRLSRAMKGMEPGKTLRVEATDDAFPADLEAWLSTRTDCLISLEIQGGVQAAVIRKSET